MEVIPNLLMIHLSQKRGMEQILIFALPSSPLMLCGCQMHQARFICQLHLQLAPPHIVPYLHHLVTTWGFWVYFQGSSLNHNRLYDQVSHSTVLPLPHQWACFPLSILRRRREMMNDAVSECNLLVAIPMTLHLVCRLAPWMISWQLLQDLLLQLLTFWPITHAFLIIGRLLGLAYSRWIPRVASWDPDLGRQFASLQHCRVQLTWGQFSVDFQHLSSIARDSIISQVILIKSSLWNI